jgi:hypothetical protein
MCDCERFSVVLGGRAAGAVVRASAVAAAGVVGADDLDGVVEGGVGGHVVGDAPAAVVPDDLDGGVPGRVERRAQLDVPVDVVAAFVPAAEVVDGQAVLLGAAEPGDQIVDGVGGPEAAADPAGGGPGEAVQLDVGVAGLGLLHQPELVPGVAVDGAPAVFDGRLGAVGGIGVPTDLGLEELQVRAVVGLEQVVQDLALLGGRVVGEQP